MASEDVLTDLVEVGLFIVVVEHLSASREGEVAVHAGVREAQEGGVNFFPALKPNGSVFMRDGGRCYYFCRVRFLLLV